MKGTLYIIPADGEKAAEERKLTTFPSLEELQGLVGGYIERVPSFGSVDMIAYCNEEGKNNGLPINERATRLWKRFEPRVTDHLVGDVIFLSGDQEFMESL